MSRHHPHHHLWPVLTFWEDFVMRAGPAALGMPFQTTREDSGGDADWTAVPSARHACASPKFPMCPLRIRIDPGKNAMMKEIYNRVE